MLKIVSALIIIISSISSAFADDITLMIYKNNDQNILSWSSNNTEASRQEVYRKYIDDSKEEKIATLLASDRTYEDIDADLNQDYYYQIKLIDNNNTVHTSNLISTLESENEYMSSVSPSASSECYAGATISNKTVDCGGKTIGLSCDGDSEDQKPVLTLYNASVKNVKISKNGGADGIHCKSGNCSLENVIWEDICEDAATNYGNKLTINGGVAYNSTSGPGGKPDKVFQHNSKNSTIEIKGNFTLTGEHGKLYRSCGDCTGNGGPRYLTINGVKIDADIGSVAGVNGNYKDVATIRNLKIKDFKYSSGKGKPNVCVEYKGVEKGNGSSPKIGEQWNTDECNISPSDVSKL
ncbi:pectate lyase [Vibrio sp. AK197]